MNWREALAAGRGAMDTRGRLDDGTPRMTREGMLGLLRAARRVAMGSNGSVPASVFSWDPFLPILAALGYDFAGDKFGRRVDGEHVIDRVYAQQLVDVDATRFAWQSLADLAARLDGAGVPVPMSGGPLAEALFTNAGGDEATKDAAKVAWARLQAERALGRDPSWRKAYDEHPVVAEAWGTKIPGRPGEVVPVPTPTLPVNPTEPPFTGPALPDGKTALVLLIVLYLATR